MYARARRMIYAKVVQLLVSAEQIAFLVVDHQLLDEFVVFGDVQVVAGRRFAGPCWDFIVVSHYEIVCSTFKKAAALCLSLSAVLSLRSIN